MVNSEKLKEKVLKIQGLIRISPNDASLMNQIALLCMETNDYEASLKWLQKAARKNPNVQSLSNLGCFYLYEGEPINNKGVWDYQPEKAISILKKAIIQKPNSYIPYSLLGEAYLLKNRYKQAEILLKKAIKYSSNPTNNNNLGVACYFQGKIEEAAYWFSEAIVKNESTDISGPSLNKGICLGLLGKKSQAEKIANTWLESKYEFKLEFSDIYFATKNFKRYIKYIPAIQKEYHLSVEWCSRFIYAYINIGKQKMAKQVVEEFIENRNIDISGLREDRGKEKYIMELEKDNRMILKTYTKIENGYIPPINFNPAIEKACYYFGCKKHKIPEYDLT